jgi:CubicO group peptidase (beta-lactamase class C family)
MTSCPRRASVLLLASIALLGSSLEAGVPRLPRAEPEAVGIDGAKLAEIDAVVADEIAGGAFPGCVVAVGRHGKLVLLEAYGHRQTVPEKVPMTTDTVFDLASVTKPVATATSVMLLVEQGKLELDAPVAQYLPEFGQNGKGKITVFQLLTHQGGLIPDNPMADYRDGPEKAWERIFALEPVAEPGTKFLYTDVGYLVLGELVRRVSGDDLDAFSRKHLFGPLGMRETTYLPGPSLRLHAAVAEKRGDHWMQGKVHDPRAFRLGGIAGHAGLFSTAEDLALFAQMMLGRGQYAGVRVLRPETVARMIYPHDVAGRPWGLGWGVRTNVIPRDPDLPVLGHLGYTGTSVRFSPELDLFFIFLSNRLHPNDPGSLTAIVSAIRRLWELTVDAVAPPSDIQAAAGADAVRTTK